MSRGQAVEEAPRRDSRGLLVAVLAGGAALRFLNLYWGLGDGKWFIDETIMWQRRMLGFRSLGWQSFDATELAYPTFYGWVTGLSAWLISWCGWPSFERMLEVLAWMRTVGAIASVLTILVVARVGAAMYGTAVGIAAAGFIAVAPLEVMQTHYASVEPVLNLLTALVLAASWRIAERGTVGAAALGGLAVGLATATKYPGLLTGSAVAWAVGEWAWRRRSLRIFVVLGVVAALACAVGFVAACPPCVLRFEQLQSTLSFIRVMALACAAGNNCIAPGIGWWGQRWLEQGVAILPYGLGAPLAALAFVGVCVAIVRRTTADRIVLAMVIPYFAYVGYFLLVFPRYTLPLFPGLALLAAAGLARLVRPRTMAIVASFVIAYGFTLSASQARRFTWDQQAQVGTWLRGHVEQLAPGERRVGISGNMPGDLYFQLRGPITAVGYTVTVQRPGEWLQGDPAFFVLPEWHRIVIRRDRRDPKLTRSLDGLDAGTSGYRQVLRIPIPRYLQLPLDERLDPAFAIDLWQGALGFTVYARDDLLARLGLEDR
jgi:4-amino-4-deoxy-L-arabinose transferase-like glycosyltransferase